MTPPDPVAGTLFLFAAFIAAGLLQALWLRLPVSARFGVPLDGRRRFRGRRIFGDNKTWRGFVVMVPGVGAAFALLGGLSGPFGDGLAGGLWPLSGRAYFLLGCWVGLAFMAAELPNSFLKRQLDIAPGGTAAHPLGRAVGFCVDRLDSLLGGLLALALVVPVPRFIWVATLLLGSVVHWLFSVLLLSLGVKRRPG
jgi:CDP-2,3-bis-(O-geranylgeranyl)-sn-glycerol synthase